MLIAHHLTPLSTHKPAAPNTHRPSSPRVDPLYLAPSSPRRSNPATPRSSPARSPAPLAPLSATAVGLGLMRSPSGVAPASAVGPVVGGALSAGRRSSSSNGGGGGSESGGARQSLTLSAGSSRGAQGRAGPQQQQGVAGVRRVSSAPPTPASTAPSAAGAAAGRTAGGSSGGSLAGLAGRRSSSSNGVSHESLYCQRLAYGGGSQRNTVAPGVRKTDRVARFQQMQQQWQRDR